MSRPSASSCTTRPSASRIGFRGKSRAIRCPEALSISTSCLTISPSRAPPQAGRSGPPAAPPEFGAAKRLQGGAVAQRGERGGIGLQDPPLEIEQPLELVGAVEDCAEAPLAVLPLLVHPAALAHIAAHPEEQERGAVGTALLLLGVSGDV